MAIHIINATSRKDEGKGASRRLRHAGQVPAIVYGANLPPESVQLNHEKLWLIQQNEWFYASILDLDVDGKVQKVLLRDMQRHPYKQVVMHVDFQRIDENAPIRFKVPLHFTNQESSPAGKLAGVVITHELNAVEVSALPKDLPEFIEVDLSGIKSTDVLKVSDLKMPPGVKPVLRGKENPVVVTVSVPGAQAEEDTSAAPTPAAEVPATAQKAPPAAAPAGAAKGGDKKK